MVVFVNYEIELKRNLIHSLFNSLLEAWFELLQFSEYRAINETLVACSNSFCEPFSDLKMLCRVRRKEEIWKFRLQRDSDESFSLKIKSSSGSVWRSFNQVALLSDCNPVLSVQHALKRETRSRWRHDARTEIIFEARSPFRFSRFLFWQLLDLRNCSDDFYNYIEM